MQRKYALAGRLTHVLAFGRQVVCVRLAMRRRCRFRPLIGSCRQCRGRGCHAAFIKLHNAGRGVARCGGFLSFLISTPLSLLSICRESAV